MRSGLRVTACSTKGFLVAAPDRPHHQPQHGDESAEDNLAWACVRSNAWKGSDIGSLEPSTGRLVRLSHPRRDRWDEHFHLAGALIEPLTSEGFVTARLLKLNIDKRVVERRLLMAIGRYPGGRHSER